MATMTAYQLTGWQKPAEFVELPVPRPGPGEVLVKVAGVGLCHSDLLFLDVPEGFFDYHLPFTLGHEIAGWVDELGEGVDDLAAGRRRGGQVPGLVRALHQLPDRLRQLLHEPSDRARRRRERRAGGVRGGPAALPGTADDARSTPSRPAGRRRLHVLPRGQEGRSPGWFPGSTAVVIGAGGLGGYAIQYLRLMTTARVIVVDVAPHRLDLAREMGATETLLASPAVPPIRCVSSPMARAPRPCSTSWAATTRWRWPSARPGPSARWRSSAPPWGRRRSRGHRSPGSVRSSSPRAAPPRISTRSCALAERGDLRLENELFAFDQLPLAYERLRAGDLRGRAVVTPND